MLSSCGFISVFWHDASKEKCPCGLQCIHPQAPLLFHQIISFGDDVFTIMLLFGPNAPNAAFFFYVSKVWNLEFRFWAFQNNFELVANYRRSFVFY